MILPGASRDRLVQTLNAAYSGGLISDETLVARLDQVLHRPLIDPGALVGDLRLRSRRRTLPEQVSEAMTSFVDRIKTLSSEDEPAMLLGLDWHSHDATEVVIGRSPDCDIVLRDPAVSRRHARVVARDGSWILQDLSSMNGSRVNGHWVGRCELRPGDRLVFGQSRLLVD